MRYHFLTIKLAKMLNSDSIRYESEYVSKRTAGEAVTWYLYFVR